MAVEPARHLFTAEEYQRMGRLGLFTPDARLELLDGDIVEMTPIGAAHADMVDRLAALLFRRLGDRAVVRIQNPIRLNDLSEPQPDLAVVQLNPGVYARRLPRPEEIYWLIEVADTTARWDRRVRAPLYARAGIRELWIVNIAAGVIEVATDPATDGYRQVREVTVAGSVTPAAFSDLTIAARDIIG